MIKAPDAVSIVSATTGFPVMKKGSAGGEQAMRLERTCDTMEGGGI